MRVEFNSRYLLMLLSIVPLILLREHRVFLLGYAVVLGLLIVLTLTWLPRRTLEAERRFSREALTLLAHNDGESVDRLVSAQHLLKYFGRRHIIPETLALFAHRRGDDEQARLLLRQALDSAPPSERLRLEVNLAAMEFATGRLVEAEGHYRAVLRRRPDLYLAQGQLGLVLLARKVELPEAIECLSRALPMSDALERRRLEEALSEARSLIPGH